MIPLQFQIYTASKLGHITYITQFFAFGKKNPEVYCYLSLFIILFLYFSLLVCLFTSITAKLTILTSLEKAQFVVWFIKTK